MPEKVRALVEEFRAGKISRRAFIGRAALLMGSLAAAATLLESLQPARAAAAQVDPADPSLVSMDVEYTGPAGTLLGYLSRPEKPGKYPAVIVVHENRGMNDHIRDVARRLAKTGYVALAPDYLSRGGGSAKVNPEGQGLREQLRQFASIQNVVADTEASIAYLRTLPEVNGDRIGMVGFCWGGGMTFAVAAKIKELKAAVVYYGRSPRNLEEVRNIVTPIMAHYGGEDERINKGIPATAEAMKKYDKIYDYKIYPGAQHAFNNDTSSSRYHPEAAREAWQRTLDFFRKYLQA